jgi:hypothetical protein
MYVDAAIIGVDGSGKSTCFRKVLELLTEAYTVMGIGDDVYLGQKGAGVRSFSDPRWTGIKRKFRTAAKRTRNPLLYEITKLAELVCWSRIHKELQESHMPQIILSDGAPLINIAGWGIRYHPRFFHRAQCAKAIDYLSARAAIPLGEALFYLRNIPEILLFNWTRIAPFAIPHTTFFLEVAPHVAIQRIERRGEDLQTHETLEFLKELQGAYELVCDILETDLGRRVHRICVDNISPDETAAEIAHIARRNLEVSARDEA